MKRRFRLQPELKDGEQKAQLPANTRTYVSQSSGNTKQLKRTPVGTPDAKYNVKSVYDSRPINGYDFNISDRVVIGGESFENPQYAEVSFNVPYGKVCVLRRARISFNPQLIIASRNSITCTIRVDDVDVQNNVNVPVGQDLDDVLNCFVIADEQRKVTARVHIEVMITPSMPYIDEDQTLAYMHVHFYGQFLTKSGSPVQLEIANKEVKPADASVKVSDSEVALSGIVPRKRIRIRR
jgi:hypothetical protein